MTKLLPRMGGLGPLRSTGASYGWRVLLPQHVYRVTFHAFIPVLFADGGGRYLSATRISAGRPCGGPAV